VQLQPGRMGCFYITSGNILTHFNSLLSYELEWKFVPFRC